MPFSDFPVGFFFFVREYQIMSDDYSSIPSMKDMSLKDTYLELVSHAVHNINLGRIGLELDYLSSLSYHVNLHTVHT